MNVKNMVWQDEDRVIAVMFYHDNMKAKSKIAPRCKPATIESSAKSLCFREKLETGQGHTE